MKNVCHSGLPGSPDTIQTSVLVMVMEKEMKVMVTMETMMVTAMEQR